VSLYSVMVHTLTTKRMKSGVGIQKTYQINLASQQCLIQPISAEYAAKTGLVFDRSFNCYVPIGTDIQIGDRGTDQDGKQYMVSGSLKRNYGVYGPHLTFILTEQVTSTPDQ
jgi:hypothetical protein